MSEFLFPETAAKSAVLSLCGTYRYRLERAWDDRKGTLTFVMLNPSTADHEVDDPTIRRCIGFAKAENCGRLVVVNLFAFRSPRPEDLKFAADPVGPENDEHLVRAAAEASTVVAAWGASGWLYGRDEAVLALLARGGVVPYCLGRTKAGHPRHPLYLPKTAALEPLGGDL